MLACTAMAAEDDDEPRRRSPGSLAPSRQTDAEELARRRPHRFREEPKPKPGALKPFYDARQSLHLDRQQRRAPMQPPLATGLSRDDRQGRAVPWPGAPTPSAVDASER